MPIVAICGPDGVGKSTLVAELEHALGEEHRVTIVYGGKKTNHHLPTTTAALHVLEFMRRVPGLRRLARAYQAVVFQPLEYLENRARWSAARRLSRSGGLVLFDRFVVDRMWRHYVPSQGRSLVKVNVGDRLFHWIYDRYFPAPDAYLFLSPEADLMFARAPGEYRSVEHADVIRSAYDALAAHLTASGRKVCRVCFGADDPPGEVARRALLELGI